MKVSMQSGLTAAGRFYAPLMMLFAATLMLDRAPGTGVGSLAGLAFALAFAVHVLVLGSAAARAAFPPWLARLVLGASVALAIVGAGAPGLLGSARMIEAGAFGATVAASALILTALSGRVPTLRSGEAP